MGAEGTRRPDAPFFYLKIVLPYKYTPGMGLKYTLRGIEKYIDNPEIIIIGDAPMWVKNIARIPFKDEPNEHFKSRNIYEKILLGPNEFLFFNDDHFLLAPFTADIYHYSGTLSAEIKNPQLFNTYRSTIQNTIDLFGDLKNFDTHCPIFYRKEILEKINVDWGKKQGYCIKSIYAHLSGIEGAPYPDLKIRGYMPEDEIKKLIEGRPYFSTGKYAVTHPMLNVLESLYPEKSYYEI